MQFDNINPLWLLIISFSVAGLPILLALMTCYAKVSIVVGMLKSALGVPHVPGVLVEGVLSLIITFIVMSPLIRIIASEIEKTSNISFNKVPSSSDLNALKNIITPLETFLKEHTDEYEKSLVIKLFSDEKLIASTSESNENFIQTLTAFLLSELKHAFILSYKFLLPFLAIDLIVANILVGLGIFMMSPTTITLPLKLFIFIKANGWFLLIQSLVRSY